MIKLKTDKIIIIESGSMYETINICNILKHFTYNSFLNAYIDNTIFSYGIDTLIYNIFDINMYDNLSLYNTLKEKIFKGFD